MYIINVESGQLTRVPRAPQNRRRGGGGNQGGGGGGFGGGPGFVFARDGRTLYFRSGNGLVCAPLCRADQPAGAAQTPAAARGGAAARRAQTPRAGGRQRHGARA